MNYTSLFQTLAKSKNEESHVAVYVEYLRTLEFTMPEKKAADLYNKVRRMGLYIDGEDVSLVRRGAEIRPEYAYTAYKNAVLKKYPDTIFDWGLVKEGDEFQFIKQDGRVTYTHKMNDPFKVGRKIVGAYGIIKNKTGEFLELVNEDDIEKFQRTSKMKNIWRDWLDRMVLKSVIKRICHTAFKDITEEMDREDNENYDLDLVGIALEMQERINNLQSVKEVDQFYVDNVAKTQDQAALVKVCKERKEQILKEQNDGSDC